ncbi:uncharacterized protein LOC125219706 [Salvia hispanica]|uniref:uncharacterized protein LOC125219706 n=1 Tax=Salvia hispanica TaxID=49212 RepID=UPI00200924D7|nr:uncharacterized protein LOC125219706 [Salvia hispanica]
MTSPSKSQPQLFHSRTNRDADLQFAPIPAMETDHSGAISPPLWGNTSPSPSRPLLSPDSRAQAIARGRTELMEMVRHMPESSYELSLKDIVEHHHRAENQIEGGADRGGGGGLKKEESRKIERRLSFEDKGFFLNMAFPFAFMSKRRKKTVVVGGGGSGRVSPKPEGWKGGGERDWWKKKFTGSSDSDSSRTSNTSSTATTTTTTSSDSGGRRRNGFTTGCWQFLQVRRTKSA